MRSVLLGRWYPAFAIAALTAAAFFTASGLGQLVGAALAPGDTPPTGGSLRQRRRRPLFDERRRAKNILRRNLFDHRLGPLDGSASASDDSDPDADVDGEPSRCDESLRLVSTVVYPNRRWSIAAIATKGDTRLYRRGAAIQDKELERIGWRAVFLSEGDERCRLELFDPEERVRRAKAGRGRGKKKAGSGTGRGRERSSKNSELSRIVDESVEKVGEREWNVDRTLVDRLMENQAALMRQTRILPHRDGDRVTGFKVHGVRRSSLLGKIGLRNGDVIHAINGHEMTGPASALEAYTRLRSADRLTVSITRRGRQMNLDYNIR